MKAKKAKRVVDRTTKVRSTRQRRKQKQTSPIVAERKMKITNEEAESLANDAGYFVGDVFESCFERVFEIVGFKCNRLGEIVALNKEGHDVEIRHFTSSTKGFRVLSTGEMVEFDYKSWRLIGYGDKRKEASKKQKGIQLAIWSVIL